VRGFELVMQALTAICGGDTLWSAHGLVESGSSRPRSKWCSGGLRVGPVPAAQPQNRISRWSAVAGLWRIRLLRDQAV